MKWIKEYNRIKKIDERALNGKSLSYMKGSFGLITNIALYKNALDELISYTIGSEDFERMIEEIPEDQEEAYRVLKFLKELNDEVNGKIK